MEAEEAEAAAAVAAAVLGRPLTAVLRVGKTGLTKSCGCLLISTKRGRLLSSRWEYFL